MKPAEQTPEAAAPASAIAMALSAYVLFSCLDASAKYLVLQGLPAPFVAWSRFCIHTVWVLLIFRVWTNASVFRMASAPGQIFRSVLLLCSTVMMFFALRTLQLAETVSVMFFAPMVITALAGPILGEWAGWRRWLAVLVGLVGVLIITRPGFGTFGVGHFFVLSAMSTYSLYVIMTRKLGGTETAESMILYSALIPAILMLPAVPFYWEVPNEAMLWGLLLALGFFGAMGHYLLIRAFQLATTSAMAPFAYTQMLWMITLGFLIFGDLPDRWTIIGAVIIVASGLYIVHREHRLRLRSRSTPNSEAADLSKKL